MTNFFDYFDNADQGFDPDLVEDAPPQQQPQVIQQQHNQQAIDPRLLQGQVPKRVPRAQVQQERIMAEAERRLYKASYYKELLNQQFWGPNGDAIAREVEEEFRSDIIKRLNILMGMEQPEAKPQKQFTEKQAYFLRSLCENFFMKNPEKAMSIEEKTQRKREPSPNPPQPRLTAPKLQPRLTQQPQQEEQFYQEPQVQPAPIYQPQKPIQVQPQQPTPRIQQPQRQQGPLVPGNESIVAENGNRFKVKWVSTTDEYLQGNQLQPGNTIFLPNVADPTLKNQFYRDGNGQLYRIDKYQLSRQQTVDSSHMVPMPMDKEVVSMMIANKSAEGLSRATPGTLNLAANLGASFAPQE